MKSLLSFNFTVIAKGARQSLAPLAIFYLLIFSPFNIFSQQTYFEKRFDFNNNFDQSQNILAIDSGYIITGITEDVNYYYQFHLSITKISFSGDELFHKEYGYDSINFYVGNPGSIIKFGNKKYFSCGGKRIYTDNWVHDEGMLVCYNDKFDTLWTHLYGEKNQPYDSIYFFYQFKKTLDNSLIFTGLLMPNGPPQRIWLLKTDSLGNKLWERFYGEGNEYFQGHSVVQTGDGGYVIGGFKFKIGYNYTGDPLIIKVDSLGNEEWRINPGNPNVNDNKVMVALASDGNIIAGTNFGVVQNGDNRDAENKIMKISFNGQIIWSYNYGESKPDNFLLNTTVLLNGNIISNGSYTSYYQGEQFPITTSWILCVDSLGNQLWYKEYALLTGHNSFNDLYDVRETADGGLIGVGKVDPVVPDTGTADIWVMKMDSLGCLWEGCDTTVDVVETVWGRGNTFKLYPNPVSDAFTIKPKNETTQKRTFTVFNMYGTKVKEVVIPPGSQSIRVQTNGWPGGVYLGVLSSKGKMMASKRFVVTK